MVTTNDQVDAVLPADTDAPWCAFEDYTAGRLPRRMHDFPVASFQLPVASCQ
jgi:hypothetical protein